MKPPLCQLRLTGRGNPRLKNLVGILRSTESAVLPGFPYYYRVQHSWKVPTVKVACVFQSTMYDSSHFVLEDCPTGMNLPENRYNSRVKFHCFRTWHKIWYTRSVGKDLCCMSLLNEFCIITFSFFEMMSKSIFSPYPHYLAPSSTCIHPNPPISCPFIYMYKIQSSKMLHL